MKKHLFSRMVVVGALVMMVGFSTNIYAQMGKGPGNPATGTSSSNLTDEQIKMMESQRNTFQSATADIRSQLSAKHQALQAELAKQAPDAATASSLQKQISDLQAQFDQKRIAHILEMKKIDPNFSDGRGMGPGMMGRGAASLPAPFGTGQPKQEIAK